MIDIALLDLRYTPARMKEDSKEPIISSNANLSAIDKYQKSSKNHKYSLK